MKETVNKAVIVYAESTPNPATLKFVANFEILETGSLEYLRSDNAAGAPIAEALFQFPFVNGVYINSNFITITKTDSVDWMDVMNELRDFIRNYLIDGKPLFLASEVNRQQQVGEVEETETNKKPVSEDVNQSKPKSEIDKKIVSILDEYIKPAVEVDGGEICFKSFKDGKVNVILKGACSGCPSSTFTLKAGIEQLLQRMVPEVKEVVAING